MSNKGMSKESYKELSAEFPKEAMTKDESRGFALTSIKAQYVRERLNEVMGVDGWETNSEVVNIDAEGNVAVKLQMTLHFPERSVTRTAFGGAAKKKKGQTVGDIFKSAETDALCKVASNFGVGNSVFKGLVDPYTLTLKGAKNTNSNSSSPKPAKSATSSSDKPSFRKPKKKVETEETFENYGDDI